MIPGDLLSAFPQRQFHTLPGLLDSWAAPPIIWTNLRKLTLKHLWTQFHQNLCISLKEVEIYLEMIVRNQLLRSLNDFWSVVYRNLPKLHKTTHISMKNVGNIPILINLVWLHTKFEANQCSSLREVGKIQKITSHQQRWTPSYY